MIPDPYRCVLEAAAERAAHLIVEFKHLAGAFHDAHNGRGVFWVCDHPECRRAKTTIQTWAEAPPPPLLPTRR